MEVTFERVFAAENPVFCPSVLLGLRIPSFRDLTEAVTVTSPSIPEVHRAGDHAVFAPERGACGSLS
jgi:hypothetical protein